MTIPPADMELFLRGREDWKKADWEDWARIVPQDVLLASLRAYWALLKSVEELFPELYARWLDAYVCLMATRLART
jgi:hypothetical protein